MIEEDRKKGEKKRGIIILLAVAITMVLAIASASAQPLTAIRDISPTLADKGDIVNVQIRFTATENLAGVGITEDVPRWWNVTDMQPSGLFDRNKSEKQVEILIFGEIPSGTNVSATYKLHIPDYAVDGEYSINGWLKVAGENIPIEGDNVVMVSSETDEEPPVIHSVNISKKEATPGENIYVTAKVTDDVRVKSVIANEVRLSQQGDNWVGYIKAEEGINVPVLVMATDAAGKITADSSQRYNATGAAEATPTAAPSGDGNGGNGGGIPPAPPVGTPPYIDLKANPADFPADGISTSTISASVWDGEKWVLENLTINFSTSSGNITVSALIINGTATAVLTAGTEEGAATITAEADLSGDIGIITITNTSTVNFTTPGVTPTPLVLTPTPTVTVSPTPTVTVSPTPTPTEEPGFEAVFAIAGMLAVAYVALRRKRK